MQLGPAVWYEALASELGVVIKTGDPQGTKMKLYAIRKELNDPDLDQISVMQSPDDPGGELWLVKRNGHATQRGIPPGESDPQPT
jgi:hypothetical protein